MRCAVLLLGATAYADLCRDSELPCSRAARAPVVFTGTVIGAATSGGATRMRVERAIRGIEAGAEVRVVPIGARESFSAFPPGDRWLVMGVIEDGAVHSGWCDGMRRIGPAGSPVAKMVEALSGGPNLVAGRLMVGAEPLGGATVLLSREGVDLSTTSDESGWFEWRDVRPGSYQFVVRSNTIPIFVRFGRNAEVPSRGCTVAHAGVFPAGQIDGFVLTDDGRPLARFPVIALEKSAAGVAAFPVRRTVSSKDGSYSLSGLREGTYIVAAEPPKNPLGAEFATRYYPAADSPVQASPVIVSGRLERGIDIRMAPRRGKVPVAIRVVFADDRPAKAAMIRVELDGIDLLTRDPRDIRKSLTDENGFARQELIEGEEYDISATWARVESSGPPKVITRMAAEVETIRAQPGIEVRLVLR